MTLAGRLLAASRPLSWVNTAYPFAAAYLLTLRQVDLALVVGTVFFLVPYNLALYGINDVFDYESDLRNPRKGGVEGAVLDRRLHRPVLVASAVVCLPFLVCLVAIGSPLSWLVLAVCMFALLSYSVPPLRLKERAVLDSLTSSAHFVAPALYGLVLAGAILDPPLLAVLAAFLLWGMASHAFGAVQDILADRAAGIRSIATVFGARVTARLAVAGYALAGVLVLFSAWPGPLAAIVVVPYLVAVAPFVALPDERAAEANRGWRRFLVLNFVAGFAATLLLVWYAMLTG